MLNKKTYSNNQIIIYEGEDGQPMCCTFGCVSGKMRIVMRSVFV
jgi:hypothetical protein